MNAFSIALAAVLVHAGANPAEDRAASQPAWIEHVRESKLPLYLEAIEGKLWATRDEARSDVLDLAAKRSLEFAAEADPRIRDAWQVPTWFVQDYMLSEPVFVEEVDWTYGPMYKGHVLLDLSPEKRDRILSQWHSAHVQRRISQVGAGLGFVLVCATTLLGYLRLDDATRGYYSRWLATGALTIVSGSAVALYSWLV